MYEIKVLDSDEFDKVAKSDPRYSYVDDSNMGFADRQKGVAYVRGTHIHDLNKYLISHELEELEEDESTHEDQNGIRHKKGLKFWKQIIAPLSYNPGGIFGGVKGPLNLFGEGGALNPTQIQPQENMTISGSGQNFPFGNFTVSGTNQPSIPASSRVSETVTGGIQSGLNQGQGFDGIQGLPPDLVQRLKGAPSGRVVF